MKTDLFTERRMAVMQLRQGKTITEVANDLGRSTGWVCKWKQRYEAGSWTGLKEISRTNPTWQSTAGNNQRNDYRNTFGVGSGSRIG